MARPLPFHVAIAGPTASGKTAAALAIAQRHATEIISVDSALVYRGMDIGTAKPTPAELAAVPHHLINIREPDEPYSAADFARDAARLMDDIAARGKLPVLVGGTMLYFKALWQGLDDLPPANSLVRAAIERDAAAWGWPALHARLREVDAVTAQRLSPNDSQRIGRALEVFQITGKPLSVLHLYRKEQNFINDHNKIDLQSNSGAKNINEISEKVLISLEPSDRSVLHHRMTLRFDLMLQAGFLDEVSRLRTRPGLHADLPAMRAVGYRQAWEALDAEAQLSATSLAAMRERAIAATRQLAKRQLTWLRSMPERVVVPCDAPDALTQVLHRVDAALAHRASATPAR
ncbi:MAG: hypothetical protein RLZZ126_1211 [Pseudomonadota bacterium]|jgi:tRNA dimethylallyltransferase